MRVLTERERRYCRPQGRADRRSLGREGGHQQGARPRRARRRLARDRDPSEPRRRPAGHLHGRAARRAEAMDLDEVTVSISHERHMAVAVAVAHRRHDLTIVAVATRSITQRWVARNLPRPPRARSQGRLRSRARGRRLDRVPRGRSPHRARGDARRRRSRPGRHGRLGGREAFVSDPGAHVVRARRGGARADRSGGLAPGRHRSRVARCGRHRTRTRPSVPTDSAAHRVAARAGGRGCGRSERAGRRRRAGGRASGGLSS